MQSSMLWPSLSRGCHLCAGWGGAIGREPWPTSTRSAVDYVIGVFTCILWYFWASLIYGEKSTAVPRFCWLSRCVYWCYFWRCPSCIRSDVCESISSETISNYHDILDLDLDRWVAISLGGYSATVIIWWSAMVVGGAWCKKLKVQTIKKIYIFTPIDCCNQNW